MSSHENVDTPSMGKSEFDSLVNDILENPEKILNADLSTEQILEIQKRINPYAGIASSASAEGDNKRVAVVSYTNLREDYLRRFTMTSMIAFIFRMLSEWEIPAVQRRWTPPKALKKQTKASHQAYKPTMLIKHLEMALSLAKEALQAETDVDEQKRIISEMKINSLSGEENSDKEMLSGYAALEVMSSKAAGLLYAATHMAHKTGIDATNRLHATLEVGMKYPEVKRILSRFPLPPSPGELEMPSINAKSMIDKFLLNLFKFDPDLHVKSGHDASTIAASISNINGVDVSVDFKDPGHFTLEAIRNKQVQIANNHKDAVSVIMENKRNYNAVVALLRDEDLLDAALMAVENGEDFKRYLYPISEKSDSKSAVDVIPSQDTFHRWNYYNEVNYEELRTITEAIYPERPDLDWAIAVWDSFEGSQKEVENSFEKYCQRYQDEIPSSIKSLEFGKWTLLADFKENRKKIQFYNKNTEVIKRILDRHTEDKKLGANLMRNRVRQAKARNIAEDGPDAPGLSQYKRNVAENGKTLSAKNAEVVISAEEMRRLEKSRGSIKAAKELELLEQYEKTIEDLSEMEKLRPLSAEETRALLHAKDNVDKAREMIAVPDDTIQVDVFTNDTTTGEFGKSHFYTKSEAPEHMADKKENDTYKNMAPFAVEHMLKESEPRTDKMRHMEASQSYNPN